MRVVLVAGVPGAGKTTVARELARRLPRAAHLEGDLVQHHLTVSGLVSPGERPLRESGRQLRLRWRNLAALADNFAEEEFTAVVDCAVSRRSVVRYFLDALRTRPVSLVVLAPRPEVALDRDRHRPDKQVADHFAHMDTEIRNADYGLAGHGWWLDSSDLTVAETVDRVLAGGIGAGVVPSAGILGP